jgi:hypothetical protein
MRARHGVAAWALVIIPALLHAAGSAEATAPPRRWGKFEFGPHAVGFRTMERYDYSRTFRDRHGPAGTVRPGERARPVLIYLWYPAEEAAGAPRMVYGEYSFAAPRDPELFPLVSRLQEREIYSALYPFFQGQRGGVVDLMNVALAAVRDATPLAGTFPLVVYHPDLRGAPGENALLCEYLASHGYTVATSHSVGGMLRDPAADLDDLEALVRDKEFIVAALRDWPQYDGDKLALAGNGFGALSALVLAMRNTDVDAVVTLGEWTAGAGRAELVARCRGYRPERFSAPLLSIVDGERSPAVSASVDSLVHSTRFLATMAAAEPRGFSNYAALAAAVPGRGADRGDSSYVSLCLTVRLFLDGHVKGSVEALAALAGAVSGAPPPGVEAVRVAHAVPAPLRDEEIAAVFWEEGVTAGVALLRRLRAEGAAAPIAPAALNTLGYQFLAAQRLEEATEIFKLETDLYPGSANAWASLGETCAYAGRADEARGCFKKTLDLLSIDTSLDDEMRDALKSQAEAMLKRLGG